MHFHCTVRIKNTLLEMSLKFYFLSKLHKITGNKLYSYYFCFTTPEKGRNVLFWIKLFLTSWPFYILIYLINIR